MKITIVDGARTHSDRAAPHAVGVTSSMRWLATAEWETTELVVFAHGPTEEAARERLNHRLAAISTEITGETMQNVIYDQEWRQWQEVCKEFRAVVGEINNTRYDKLVAEIRHWGKITAKLPQRPHPAPDAK